MKYGIVSIFMVLFLSLSFGQGWNSTVTTSLTDNQVMKADNFVNKNGIHVLTIGSNNDSPSSTVRYNLLNSTGTIVRSYTFESGGSHPCIAGDENNIFVAYWKSQTIKTWISTDAGATWSDGSIDNISIQDQYCNGIDATKDNRGIHLVYATRPNSIGAWETFYAKNDAGSNWVNNKNVTDYDANEVGGFPTVSTSTNKVHVSYNTGTGGDPSVNTGSAKTRDYNFQSQTWENPQLVYGSTSDHSMIEKVYASGSDVHLFYYKFVGGMGQYRADVYHVKRSVDGTTWSSPVLLDGSADMLNRIEVSSSTNGTVHIVYPSYGLQYRTFDGTNWSNEQLISATTTVQPYTMDASGNDIYCFWNEIGGGVKYRQYNAVPTAPSSVSASVYSGGDNNPKVSWAAAIEPDVYNGGQFLVLKRVKIGGGSWGSWVTAATLSGSAIQYIDETITSAGSGPDNVEYKVQKKDYTTLLSDYSSVVGLTWYQFANKRGAEIEFVPEGFSVQQNYPNPFNPSTTITFALPEPTHVRLTVCDAVGREVAVLSDRTYGAGIHTAVFDASAMSSGIYFYRIAAGEFTAIRKMTLMK